MKVRKKQTRTRIRWEARWYEADTRKIRGKTFDTKKEADAYLATIKVARQSGTYTDPALGKMTLRQWWDRYQGLATWSRLTPATKAVYEDLWQVHIKDQLGGRQLGSIKRLDVETWVGERLASGVGASRLNGAHRVLRRVLQTAVDSGVIGMNPAKGVEVPATPKAQERILSPAEIDRLAETVPARYRALVLTLAWTGLRIGEAAALRVENLDLLRGRVTVREGVTLVGSQIVRGQTKNKKSRTVTLPRFLREELGRHLEAFRPGPAGVVFTGPDGGPLHRANFRARVWLPALKAAKIAKPLPRIHDLRHTSVALAIMVGAHPKEIQARAGHSSITTTMDRYGHLFPGQDEALAERLDNLRASGDSHLVQTRSDLSEDVVRLRKDGEENTA